MKLYEIPNTITSYWDSKFLSHFWRTIWQKLGTKLQFNSSHYPQTFGKTEVINHILEALLRSLIEKNIQEWENLLPHAEFAYNRSINQTIGCSPFEVIYGLNPISLLDLSPIQQEGHFSGEAKKRAEFIQKIHQQVRVKILKQIEKYKKQANKHIGKVLFKEGALVWIHLRNERSPN